MKTTSGDFFKKRRHLDGRQRGVPAAVAGLGSRAFHGLFQVVGGHHAVNDRDIFLQADLGERAGHLPIDQPRVGRGALDHHAQRHERAVFLRFGAGQLLDRQRDFERARHPDNGQRVVAGAVPLEAIQRAAEQLPGEQVVKPADDNPEAQVLGQQIS